MVKKSAIVDKDIVASLFLLTTWFWFSTIDMAAKSYVIPDLDDNDNNESESLNLFSKRQKTTDDSSLTTNENITPSTNVVSNQIELPSNDNCFLYYLIYYLILKHQ